MDKVEWRQNPQVVAATLDHIQQHINLLQTSDPVLLSVIGQQPLPNPNMPQPGGPAPTGSSQVNPEPVGNQQAANIKPPTMPKNPLSKAKFDTQTGGMPQ